MKRFHLFKAASLLIACLLAFSCEKSEVKPIVDYRCQITTQSGTDGIYCNTPIPIQIEVKKNDADIGNYTFSYTMVEGDGDLFIDDTLLKAREEMSINLDHFAPRFIAKKLGDHKLMFHFSNEKYKTESLYAVTADDLVFEASAVNLPKKMLIDRPFAFDIQLIQKNEESHATEFNAQLQLLKGKGYAAFVGSEDTTSWQRFQKQSDSIVTVVTRAGYAPKETNDYKVRLGNNKVHFQSAEEGENVLLLSVENEWGYQQDLNVPLHIELPDFRVTAIADSIGNVGSINNFLLNIEDTDNFGENTYHVTYRNIKNSGTLKINNNEIQVGANLHITKGENVCEYIPNSLGETVLEFIVKDKYNTTRKDTAYFNTIRSYVDITLSGYDTTATLHETRTLHFAVDKKDYMGKYYLDLSQAPINGSNIQINGADYRGGRIEITNKQNTLINFIPQIPGALDFTLNVYDEYNSKTTKKLHFNVINSTASIFVSNYNPTLNLLMPTSFNFGVNKPNYTGKYQFEIEQFPAEVGVIGKDYGKIVINGEEYKGGRMDVLNPTNTTVHFTPTQTGEVILRLKVYDSFGGALIKDLSYTISNTDIDLRLSNADRTVFTGKETTFEFTATKPNYTDKLEYELVLTPKNAGTFQVEGREYIDGARDYISGTEIPVVFTPMLPGQAELKIIIRDKWGTEKIQTLGYTISTSDILMELRNVVPDAILNQTSVFTMSLSKQYYQGRYDYSIVSTPAHAGRIVVDNEEYNGGLVPVKNAKNTTIRFTPTQEGNISLQINVSDTISGEASKTILFNVKNNPIQIIANNIEPGLTLNRETKFNFAVNKLNYDGKFLAELTTEPVATGDIKINGTPYEGGRVEITDVTNTRVTYTPRLLGNVNMFLKVYDDNGSYAEKELNFNVKNSEFITHVGNQEADIIYNVPTNFTFSVMKEGYNDGFKYEILQDPADAGAIKINNNAYTGGKKIMENPSLTHVEFTSTQEGKNILTFKIFDIFGDSIVENVIFNVTNPPIELTLNGPASRTMTIGQKTSFQIKAAKEGYRGDFQYEITPIPVDCGTLMTDGRSALTGTLNPNPTTAEFTPTQLGTAMFAVKITDTEGKTAQKIIDFKVKNSPMSLSFASNEESVVLNNPTDFVFKVNKDDYPDGRNITYTISPAYTGTLVVDGKPYTGTSIEVPYSRIKNGLNVTYSPDREGQKGLTFVAEDEFNGMTANSLLFNVSNPELEMFLSGVNTEGINNANLGSTYKFYYNVSKANYSEDFAYWITLDPQAVGIVGTSDATPRGRSGGGVDMQTGTISSNPNGITTGEIRFTPSNAAFLDQEVSINVLIRDKWNNEKSQTVRFRIVTSAIELNVERKTSIDVEEPYMFHFTTHKPDYDGKFKYQLTGWADGDKLETSADGNTWTVYNGGKYDLPHKDHTYIRYTPAAINTIPLRLFVYDDQNGEAMKELTFDVKAPEVRLISDASMKQGYLEEFVPFTLNAEEDKGENMSVSFNLDNPTFDGELKFNNTAVTPGNSRARSAASFFNIASGSSNKLEILSRKRGTFGVTATAVNRWQQSASVTTSVQAIEKPKYTLNISQTGEGNVKPDVERSDYEEGYIVYITATPADGWDFVEWAGDASGSDPTISVTMDGNKNIQAIFEKRIRYKLNISIEGEGTVDVSPASADGTYEEGTVVTLIAKPKEIWEFYSWKGDLNGSSTNSTLTMDKNRSVSAEFRKSKMQVQIQINGKGTVMKPIYQLQGTFTVKENDVVTITKNESTDITFLSSYGVPEVEYKGQKVTLIAEFYCMDAGMKKFSTVTFTNGETLTASKGIFRIEKTFYANPGINGRFYYYISEAK